MVNLIQAIERLVDVAHQAGSAASRALSAIALPDGEALSLVALVRSTHAKGISTLGTEERAAWGALALYALARESVVPSGVDAVALYDDDDVEALASGKRLLLRFGFEGAEHELKRFMKARARRTEAAGEPAQSREPGRANDKGRRTGLRLEVTPLASKNGVHRVGVQAIGARRAEPVICTLVAEEHGVTLTLHDVDGEAVDDNRVEIFVNAPPLELRFSVTAPPRTKARARLQVAPDEPLAKSTRLPGVFVPIDDDA